MIMHSILGTAAFKAQANERTSTVHFSEMIARDVMALLMILVLACSQPASASEGFETLVQVVKSGADETTLTNYVNASPIPYALTVDEILYLSDLGISSEAITAITTHGGTTSPGGLVAIMPPTNIVAELEHAGIVIEPSGTEPIAETPTMAPPVQEVVQETVVTPPVIIAQPASMVDYSTFYDGLAPYGNWISVDNVWCWQPTAVLVNPGWSPYCQRGRWVNTDCGWAWESSYSWGWAPFHYGRWRHHDRHGWIWSPGQVWGPAWVCWRYSNTAVGWAPLPPEATFETSSGLCYRGRGVSTDFDFGLTWVSFTFVPLERFCDIGVARHRIPRSRCETVFHDTKYVQNRVSFKEGRIHNFGPPPTHITSITHQAIRPVTIVDHAIRVGAPIPRPSRSGSSVSFYRPPIAPTARETPRQVVVRHETRNQSHHDSTHHEDVFTINRNPTTVRIEQTRGRESRTAPATSTPHTTTIPSTVHRPTQPRLTEDASRQRQTEEAAARQQEALRRQVAEQIQRQNTERQQAQNQARERALAEQRHQAAEFARQQADRQRTEAAARQQDAQRRTQETLRQQARQVETEARARAADLQRQALRSQREAEESAARLQAAQTRTPRDATVVSRQREVHPPLQDIPQGYGNASTPGASSSRGATSRSTSSQDNTHPTHGR